MNPVFKLVMSTVSLNPTETQVKANNERLIMRKRTENFFNVLLASRSAELLSFPKYCAEEIDFAFVNFFLASSVS